MYLQNSDDITPNGGAKCRWGTQNDVFRPVEKSPAQTPYRHGDPRPRLCAGGGMRGVINNFGGIPSLMIAVDINKVGCVKVCG